MMSIEEWARFNWSDIEATQTTIKFSLHNIFWRDQEGLPFSTQIYAILIHP